MVIKSFPPIEYADQYGVLALGGDVEPESMLLAYQNGIFIWNYDPYLWFAPPLRAVLFLDDFHISSSLNRVRKKSQLEIKMNCNFEKVVRECSKVSRPKQKGTWLNDDIISGYIGLYQMGHAYSIEAYNGNELVGGLFGVNINRMFTGESMFHKETDASKICFCFLVDYLREKQIEWLDCQVLNQHTASFGAKEIPRDEFMRLLKLNLKKS